MEKKNESLVDDPEGKIILNESGTSVNVDDVEVHSRNIENNGAEKAVAEDALGNKTVKEQDKTWR